MQMPGVLLRLEGAMVAIGATTWFFAQGGSWIWFLVLILAPDLSAVGYLAGPRIGSYCYDAVHTYVAPGLLAAGALAAGWSPGVLLACIWAAHIGADRLVGYGLKYPSAFRDTHLQRV